MIVLCCPSCCRPLYRFIGDQLPARGRAARSQDVRHMDGSPVYARERVMRCCGKRPTIGVLRWKDMPDKEPA